MTRRKPNFCWAVVDRDLRQIEAGWCASSRAQAREWRSACDWITPVVVRVEMREVTEKRVARRRGKRGRSA